MEAGKLFQRFYTVQNGRESTGLGLSIARALVEQMGGKIWARKEEEWFTIRILVAGSCKKRVNRLIIFPVETLGCSITPVILNLQNFKRDSYISVICQASE